MFLKTIIQLVITISLIIITNALISGFLQSVELLPFINLYVILKKYFANNTIQMIFHNQW